MSGAPHVPVLRDVVTELLQPAPGKRMVDGTFGFGGHAREMLAAGCEVLGFDLDEDARRTGEALAAENPAFALAPHSFRDWGRIVKEHGWDGADGLLLDLGVSSLQLDDADKGFTYRSDSPLDLRFDRDAGESAAQLVARLDQRALADLIFEYGEERGSRRIAAMIKRDREEGPVTSTGALREAVIEAVGTGAHLNPVLSRVFQALRIAVNDELGALSRALDAIPEAMNPGGRVVVISYHSLEDRIVKQWMAREQRDCLCPTTIPICVCGHKKTVKILTRRPLRADAQEVQENPRARSARLRAAEVVR
jgi:16S rRNA (cytosine1402-N4)-methyltransferase